MYGAVTQTLEGMAETTQRAVPLTKQEIEDDIRQVNVVEESAPAYDSVPAPPPSLVNQTQYLPPPSAPPSLVEVPVGQDPNTEYTLRPLLVRTHVRVWDRQPLVDTAAVTAYNQANAEDQDAQAAEEITPADKMRTGISSAARWGAQMFYNAGSRAKDSVRSWDSRIVADIGRYGIADARVRLVKMGLPRKYYMMYDLGIDRVALLQMAQEAETATELCAFFKSAFLSRESDHTMATLHQMGFSWVELISMGMDCTHMACVVGETRHVFCDTNAINHLYKLSLLTFVDSFYAPEPNMDDYDFVLSRIMSIREEGGVGVTAKSLARLHKAASHGLTCAQALGKLGMSIDTMKRSRYTQEEWISTLAMTPQDVVCEKGIIHTTMSDLASVPPWLADMIHPRVAKTTTVVHKRRDTHTHTISKEAAAAVAATHSRSSDDESNASPRPSIYCEL